MINQGYLKNENDQQKQIGIPPELERQYELAFVKGSKKEFQNLREIKSNMIGALVSIKGIVTRCSDVKPCM